MTNCGDRRSGIGGRTAPHRRVDAWKKGIRLTEIIYRETAKFPQMEQYGLVSQMRRCAVSVPANIAEGAARESKREFVRFLHIAKGSVTELDTFVELARIFGYLSVESLDSIYPLMEDVGQLLSGLLRRNRRFYQSPLTDSSIVSESFVVRPPNPDFPSPHLGLVRAP
ncbi:MAG: four helix bundle protein [Elusimicrobia bacterium]|nr:four helix bundle protein [Elusimicrobiota bacterium]